MGAAPAQAKPVVVTPGWNPLKPPSDVAAFTEGFPRVLYTVSCGGASATGWSADALDEEGPDSWKAILVTTSAMSAACASRPEALVVRQGDRIVQARPWNPGSQSGAGTIEVREDQAYIDWDFVPSPRIGQWVALAGRGPQGESLPMLNRRIVAVGEDTFTLNAPVGAAYLGAPVVDNTARALGLMTVPGTVVTGTPQFCGEIFACTDPDRVWWDITAPSAVRSLSATPGKRSVTFTWKRAASDGGAEVAYWYRVGEGRWTYAQSFSVTVSARKGTRVKVSVVTVNDAGPGPTMTVSGKAR